MALPPRSAAVLVFLGNDYGIGTRQRGDVLEGPIAVSGDWYPPLQKEVFSYQHLLTNYPDDLIVKVHQDNVTGIQILISGGAEAHAIDSTYPDPLETVYYYDPTPPPGPDEPPPNPNGQPKNDVFTANFSFPGTFYPRWHTEDPYDLYDNEVWVNQIIPPKDTEFVVLSDGSGSAPFPSFRGKPWSVDLTVDNFDSRVTNLETDEYEFYPFDQATFDYKQTSTITIPKSWTTCCWNEGTVINGEVKFHSVEVTTEPMGEFDGEEFGFGGMFATTGSTSTDEGSESFSITVSDDYVPIEIVIPAVPGRLTFINDFVITSVTKPT